MSKINLKNDYCLLLIVWLRTLKESKLQKYRIILSQHTNYLQKWLAHFLTCLLLPCFFSARFLKMCKPKTTYISFDRLPHLDCLDPTGLAFYGSGLACLQSMLGIMNAGWLGSMQSETFLQMKFFIFQGYPAKLAAFLPWQLAPYNQFLIQPLLLIPDCYFA